MAGANLSKTHSTIFAWKSDNCTKSIFTCTLFVFYFLQFAFGLSDRIQNKDWCRNSPFPSSLVPVSKRVLVRNHSYENDFDLHENQTTCKTHFHKEGFALGLVLEQRHKRTRKWLITRFSTYLCKERLPKPIRGDIRLSDIMLFIESLVTKFWFLFVFRIIPLLR